MLGPRGPFANIGTAPTANGIMCGEGSACTASYMYCFSGQLTISTFQDDINVHANTRDQKGF